MTAQTQRNPGQHITRPAANPFALAHAVNSPQRTQMPPYTGADPAEQTALAHRRLHALYHYHRALYPVSPSIFRISLDHALSVYPVLLSAEDHLPTLAETGAIFADLDAGEEAAAAQETISENLRHFTPPAAPRTKAQFKAAEANLTRNQKQYRRTKKRIANCMDFMTFLDLFGSPLLTELYIAAHRWPSGRATCPHCRSADTVVTRYKIPDEDPDSKTMSQHETGPVLRWLCNDCPRTFTAVTGTVMETPNLPPADWLQLASTMTNSPSGISYEHHLTIAASSIYGLSLTQEEAESMRDKIRSVLPFAKPRTRQPLSTSDALKVLAAAEAPKKPAPGRTPSQVAQR